MLRYEAIDSNMPTIILETSINAPPETCFDLMRDIRIHTETTVIKNERAVAGVTDGKIWLGQTATFDSRFLGMPQRLTIKVVEFERPRLFVDEMIDGNFRSFRHVHEFFPDEYGTLLRDTLVWTSLFGVVGQVFDKLVLERHLRNLVSTRNAKLKEIAEARTPG